MDLHSLEWLKLSHNDLTRLTEDTVQPILDTLTMIDVSRESQHGGEGSGEGGAKQAEEELIIMPIFKTFMTSCRNSRLKIGRRKHYIKALIVLQMGKQKVP